MITKLMALWQRAKLPRVGLDWVRRAKNTSGLEFGTGDSEAAVVAIATRGFKPGISEEERLDLQGGLSAQSIHAVLDQLGLDPSTVEVDSLWGVATGTDGKLNKAQMESMFTTENGKTVTRAVTTYLGPDFAVMLFSSNKGRGLREDHTFLIEEEMRSVTVTQK